MVDVLFTNNAFHDFVVSMYTSVLPPKSLLYFKVLMDKTVGYYYYYFTTADCMAPSSRMKDIQQGGVSCSIPTPFLL